MFPGQNIRYDMLQDMFDLASRTTDPYISGESWRAAFLSACSLASSADVCPPRFYKDHLVEKLNQVNSLLDRLEKEHAQLKEHGSSMHAPPRPTFVKNLKVGTGWYIVPTSAVYLPALVASRELCLVDGTYLGWNPRPSAKPML
jgi:hypothetical protein